MGRKKGIQKSLQIYISKLKKPSLNLRHPPSYPSAAASRILSACKYPKTPSFDLDRDNADYHQGAAATLKDVDRFLFENFRSLCIDSGSGEPSGDSPRFTDPPPDDVRSTRRFFVSPGTSGSLAEEARTSTESDEGPIVPGGGVAVTTFSKDPYDDFRQSMQDMLDARHVDPKQPLDWDFTEELLFCYLELNDRAVHKHILRAFTDLVANFRGSAAAPIREVTSVRRRRRRRIPGDIA